MEQRLAEAAQREAAGRRGPALSDVDTSADEAFVVRLDQDAPTEAQAPRRLPAVAAIVVLLAAVAGVVVLGRGQDTPTSDVASAPEAAPALDPSPTPEPGTTPSVIPTEPPPSVDIAVASLAEQLPIAGLDAERLEAGLISVAVPDELDEVARRQVADAVTAVVACAWLDQWADRVRSADRAGAAAAQAVFDDASAWSTAEGAPNGALTTGIETAGAAIAASAAGDDPEQVLVGARPFLCDG